MQLNEQLKNLVKVGLEFEYFSDIPKAHQVSMLEKLLGVNIHYTEKHHDPNLGIVWKLEPDNSGGNNMSELITPVLSYKEANTVLEKVFNFLKEYGYTTDRSALHISLSLNGIYMGKKLSMQDLDPIKLASYIDEDKIYEMFPHRKNNVYCQSVKTLIPQRKFNVSNFIDVSDRSCYTIPQDKYRGINFSKLPKGYLEFRYCGGKGYETKLEQIRELMDNWIVTLSASFNNSPFLVDMPSNTNWIYSQMLRWVELSKDLSLYSRFIHKYPNIEVSIDGDMEPQVVSSYWLTIREKIFDLFLSKITVKKDSVGELNWNTERNCLQVRGMEIDSEVELQGYDFVSCPKIMSKLNNCGLGDTKVVNSILTSCKSVGYNQIKGCKVEKMDMTDSETFTDSYIDQGLLPVRGKLTKCIVRSGLMETEDTKDCVLIDVTKKNKK